MSLKKYWNSAFRRFLCAGIFNTLATYVIYLLCLQVMHYGLAYTIAYVSGIVFNFLLNTKYVFKSHPSLKRFICYLLVYLCQYLLGLILLWLLVTVLSINPHYAPFIVIMVTVPVIYILAKHLLTHKKTA